MSHRLVFALLLVLSACASVPDTGSSGAAAEGGDIERRAAMRLELAGAYFAQGQYNIALDEVRQALRLKPDARDALNLQALVLAAKGDAAAAEEAFRRILSAFPRDPDTLHNQAWFYCQQGKLPLALAAFEQTLAQPEYRGAARTLLAKGACEMRNERWDDARRSLSRAFELDPGNPATAFNLGDVLLRLNEAERARFYVARVNAVPAQVSAQSLWLAARIEHRLGNRPGELEWGQRLVREFPRSAEAGAYSAGRFD